MLDLILKSAIFISEGKKITGDIGIQGDTITSIQEKITEDAKETIPCYNLLVCPGGIDPHVHLRTPGNTEKEDFETGTKAAIKGGYTTVFDMPNTSPPTLSSKNLEEKRKLALEMSYANMGFFIGATKENIKDLDTSHAIGVKLYMGSTTGDLYSDDESWQEEVFKSVKKKVLVVHAEDENMIREAQKYYKDSTDPEIHSCIRHNACAESAVKKALMYATKYETKLHIAHLSTREEINLIRKAKEDGLQVTCEVTPHHLFLNTQDYLNLKNFGKINPPLRSQQDQEALWEALIDGTIDIIASDHAPHTIEEKEKEYQKAPSGVPELDTTMQLLINEVQKKKLPLERFIDITSTKVADIFSLSRRGKIEKNFIADLTIIDQKQKWTVSPTELKTKCKWSPYEGKTGTGKNILTIIGGEVVYDNNIFHKSHQCEIF